MIRGPGRPGGKGGGGGGGGFNTGMKASPVRVPEGLKSSPSSVTQRDRTSLLKARAFAVLLSCTSLSTFETGCML